MMIHHSKAAGLDVLLCSPEGPLLASEQDAADLVGEAMSLGVTTVAIPTARFGPDFFDLRTRIAGLFVQKFVTYHIRLAVLGDVSSYVAGSDAFAAFVRETNSGRELWFLTDLEQLGARLVALSGRGEG